MSYVSQALPYTTVSAGTRATGTATTAITITVGGTMAIGDLVVAVIYSSMDPGAFKDAGEGWLRLGYGWDASNTYGLSVWGGFLRRTSGVLGLTAASSGNYCSQCYAYRPVNAGLRFALSEAVDDRDWYNATADSRVQSWNPMRGPGLAILNAQGITLLAAGCTNNASVLPTASAPTGWTERFDTGTTAAPSFNIWLGDRNIGTPGAPDQHATVTNASFWSNTSARTKRAGIRVFIPIVGYAAARRGRYGAARRIAS